MAKINELAKNIEGFDAMSAEEKLNAIMNLSYTSEGEDKLKQMLSRANAESADYKKQLREKQTEDERKEAERKEYEAKMQEELTMLRKEKTISEYTTNFVSVGYDSNLAKESAEAMANGNFSKVFDGFKTFVTSKEQAIRAEALKGTPKPDGSKGTGSATITQEQFDAMGYPERAKLLEENPELYAQLTK